jgi:hypothetical protein
MRIDPIDSAGVMLTYRCSSRCKHCFVACGPEWNCEMSREDIVTILSGIKEINRKYEIPQSKDILRQGVHFTGGETFLNFPLLVFAIQRAQDIGVPVSHVETNASWCTDREQARARWKALQDLGVKRIWISCTLFHAESIPLNRVRLGISTASDVFGPGNVIVSKRKCISRLAEFDADKTVEVDKWIDRYGEEKAGQILRDSYWHLPTGRAGPQLCRFLDTAPAEEFKGEACRAEIVESRQAHFDPFGNYIPNVCGGLSIGDARDLPSFYESFRTEYLPLIDLLVAGGPYGLMELAEKEVAYRQRPEGYIGKCHLCVDVRKHMVEEGEDRRELAPKSFYEHLS